jgi:hypothetical protein
MHIYSCLGSSPRLGWDVRDREVPAVEMSPDLVRAVIMKTALDGNNVAVEMILGMELSIDGAGYSTLVTPHHFVAAAQRKDSVSIWILLMKGKAVFPLSQSDVANWRRKLHESTKALACHCYSGLLVRYLDYSKEK